MSKYIFCYFIPKGQTTKYSYNYIGTLIIKRSGMIIFEHLYRLSIRKALAERISGK